MLQPKRNPDCSGFLLLSANGSHCVTVINAVPRWVILTSLVVTGCFTSGEVLHGLASSAVLAVNVVTCLIHVISSNSGIAMCYLITVSLSTSNHFVNSFGIRFFLFYLLNTNHPTSHTGFRGDKQIIVKENQPTLSTGLLISL